MIENTQAVQRLYYSCQKRREAGAGARSMRIQYKEIKAAVRLYINGDPAIAMVCEFEERLEELVHS